MKSVLVAGAALMLAGCATAIVGDKQPISVVIPNVEGASCKLTDARNRFWYLPNAPGEIVVDKGGGPLNVLCEKKGFTTTLVTVKGSVAANEAAGTATAGLLAAFGASFLGAGALPLMVVASYGLLMDAGSGAIARYPDTIVVDLKPAAGETAPAAGGRPDILSRIEGLQRLSPMRVAVAVAPVRAKPSPVGEVVGMVRVGDRVHIVDTVPSGWLQIAEAGEPIGWLHWTAMPIPRESVRIEGAPEAG